MFNKNQSQITAKTVETIIGPSVKVEGNFKGEGDLLIDGVLIGNLETENNLKVGSGAIIEANIKANNAFISGKIKGNIVIKGKLEITATAVILGDIRTQILSIEAGAKIQGKVSMPTGKLELPELTKSSGHRLSAEEETPEPESVESEK